MTDSILTDAQVKKVATMLNHTFNVRVLNEKQEYRLLVGAINQIEKVLVRRLPEKYIELLGDVSDGISPSEADLLVERLSTAVNRHFNIPVISEKAEQRLLENILAVIVKAMQKGRKI